MSHPTSNFSWPKEKSLEIPKLQKLKLLGIIIQAISQQDRFSIPLGKVLGAISWGCDTVIKKQTKYKQILIVEEYYVLFMIIGINHITLEIKKLNQNIIIIKLLIALNME